MVEHNPPFSPVPLTLTQGIEEAARFYGYGGALCNAPGNPHGPVSLQAICDRWNLHLGLIDLKVCESGREIAAFDHASGVGVLLGREEIEDETLPGLALADVLRLLLAQRVGL